MPFITERKRASFAEQRKGCRNCGRTDLVLYHFTDEGGVKAHHVVNRPGEMPRKKDLSADSKTVWTKEAFCSGGCYGLAKSRAEKPFRASDPLGLYRRPWILLPFLLLPFGCIRESKLCRVEWEFMGVPHQHVGEQAGINFLFRVMTDTDGNLVQYPANAEVVCSSKENLK